MKNTLLLITFLVLAMAFCSGTAIAQTTTYQTITTAAINATQTCFVLAATTSMQASGALSGPGGTPQEWDLWFDGEYDKINTVNTTSNQVCVQRGKSPTRAGIHATAQVVFYGPGGAAPFILSAPLATSPGVLNQDGQFGSCVSTGYLYLPLINVANGSVWNCLTTAASTQSNPNVYGHWVVYGLREWTTGHPLVNVFNAAYTMTLADEYVLQTFNEAGTARTDTLPSVTGIVGKTVTVKHNGRAGLLTILAPNGQFVGTTGTASITLTNGGSSKLLSIQNSAGAWGWATID